MGSAADIISNEPTLARAAGVELPAVGAESRANTVAQEIAVNATGTRTGGEAAKRELFSEETSTVLVSPAGAVIRLAAAVAAGQLIFLTNKNTKQEVVCQVVGLRSYRPTSSYVELQFTEKLGNFWGIAFPEVAEEAKIAKAPEAANRSQVSEPEKQREYVIAEKIAAPTEQNAESLKDEMELLQQQLRKSTKGEAKADPEIKAETSAGAVTTSAAEKAAMNAADPGVPPIVAAGEAGHGVAIPWPKEMGIAEAAKSEPKPVRERSSHIAMQLPKATDAIGTEANGAQPNLDAGTLASSYRELPKHEPEEDLLDELLPKPALDFSKAPKRSTPIADGDEGSIYKSERAKMGKLVLGILATTLIVLVGLGAWKIGLLARLTRLGSHKAVAAPAKPIVSVPSEAVRSATVPEPAATVSAPGTTIGDVKPRVPSASTEVPKKVEETTAAPTAAVASPEAKSEKSVVASPKSDASLRVKKKSSAVGQAANAVALVAPLADDGVVLPAKLLKAAKPVYPPDAMRSFITGDVKLKAVVDANGKVRDMEVVSGPAALRTAALEALMQYQYEAATRGGKGVASEVRVVIKFWFDP